MSPTTLFSPPGDPDVDVPVQPVGERCTRGGAAGGVLEGCYTGYPAEAVIEAYLWNMGD